MRTQELTAKIRDLKSLKLMADELEAQITSIEDEIKKKKNTMTFDEIISTARQQIRETYKGHKVHVRKARGGYTLNSAKVISTT